MKQLTATFFTILAILYLADRYTGFDMMPAVLIGGASIMLAVIVLAVAGGLLRKNLYSFTLLILTILILLSIIV